MSETKEVVHGEGRLEHSLCGLAPEAYESGDHPEPVVMAGQGELVTCPLCRLELDYMRSAFKGYRATASAALEAHLKGQG